MPKPQYNYFQGMLLYIGASFFFTNVNAFVKFLSQSYPLSEILLARAIVPFVIFCIHAGMQGRLKRIKPKSKLRVFSACSTFIISLGSMFYGFTIMPFAEMTIYMFTAPFFTVVIMRFLDKELITKARLLVLALGFAGVVIASGADGVAFDFSMFIGLFAGFMMAVANITMSKASRAEHVETVLFWFPILGLLVVIFFLPKPFVPIPLSDLWMLIVLGMLSYIGGTTLVKSLTLAPVTFLSPFSYLTFVVASVYGIFIFNEPLTTQLIIGAVIIIISGICNHKMGRS